MRQCRVIAGLNVEVPVLLEVYLAFIDPIYRKLLCERALIRNSLLQGVLSTKRFCKIVGKLGGVDRSTVPSLQHTAKREDPLANFITISVLTNSEP